MRGTTTATLIALALAGCAAGPQPMPKISYYDLGPVAASPGDRAVASMRSIDVYAPSWLDSSALQYRLAYRGRQQRLNYAESRWVAPPAEMIGQALRKRMLSARATGACKLRIDLDEFAHVFDAVDSSRAVLEARVQLFSPGGELLGRRAIAASRPAASADARGGVAALAGAVEDLGATLRDWLGGLDRETGPGLNVMDRCRGH